MLYANLKSVLFCIYLDEFNFFQKVSERSLVQSLVNEKNKVILLNNEIASLEQILHESEILNDSFENHTFHIKIETIPKVQNKNLLEVYIN